MIRATLRFTKSGSALAFPALLGPLELLEPIAVFEPLEPIAVFEPLEPFERFAAPASAVIGAILRAQNPGAICAALLEPWELFQLCQLVGPFGLFELFIYIYI